MEPYEILEHTADAKFRSYGKTMEEAFANATLALTALVADPQTLDRDRESAIEIHAFEKSRLLFDLLDQLLFLIDTEHFLTSEVSDLSIIHHLGRYSLTAKFLGTDVKKVGGNLKAITYHEMIVQEQPDGTWVCQAVVDI